MELADGGTRVVLVPENHDELIRDFVGNAFGKIAIERQAVHLSATGKRLLITHGDEFESWIRCSAFTRLLGCAPYAALLRLNRAYNRWRSWRGKPYWSLATYVKHRVANARRAIDSFERAASATSTASSTATTGTGSRTARRWPKPPRARWSCCTGRACARAPTSSRRSSTGATRRSSTACQCWRNRCRRCC